MLKSLEREVGGDWLGLVDHMKKFGLYLEGTWEPHWILIRGMTPVSGSDLYLEGSPYSYVLERIALQLSTGQKEDESLNNDNGNFHHGRYELNQTLNPLPT